MTVSISLLSVREGTGKTYSFVLAWMHNVWEDVGDGAVRVVVEID